MSIDLPKPIATYIAAENGNDAEALAQCFIDQAVVRDENQTIEGLAAIKLWKVETKRKYQHRIEPRASVQKDGNTITGSGPEQNSGGRTCDLSLAKVR